MTGDLAVSSRPAVAERPSSEAARHRPKATTRPAAQPAPAEIREVNGPAAQSAAQPDPARLKARLADPAVRVRAHRDDATARLILQVVDRSTGEVIEQYPPEQLLRFYAALRESLGALVDERA
jgi:flagellar protein FlaG